MNWKSRFKPKQKTLNGKLINPIVEVVDQALKSGISNVMLSVAKQITDPKKEEQNEHLTNANR